MKSYYVGYEFGLDELKDVSKWCNRDGSCHVEETSAGSLIIVENHSAADSEEPIFDSEPSLEDRIKELEAQNEFLKECLIEIGNIIYA